MHIHRVSKHAGGATAHTQQNKTRQNKAKQNTWLESRGIRENQEKRKRWNINENVEIYKIL